MALKLQMQLNKPDEFWLEVFHTDAVAAGDSVDIADGITLTNMSPLWLFTQMPNRAPPDSGVLPESGDAAREDRANHSFPKSNASEK